VELTVVIMAFNEIATLEATCLEIGTELSRLATTAEIVIVDDGSTDGTGALADRLAGQDTRVRVVHHDANRGLGGVYRTGFADARGRYLTFFPADGQFPASIIGEFLPRMSDCDLVLGYLPSRPRSYVARALSIAERSLYVLLFGAMPRFQGIMMIRVARLRTLTLRSAGRGWAVVMEFILRAARTGWKIESRPTTVRPRQHGQSKVNNLRTIISNMRQVLTLWREIDAA
jgi:glycosyltransferase involved in cell wall biosynthesis